MHSRRQDLLTGLLVAVTMICTAAVWNDHIGVSGRDDRMVPAFQHGLSALPLTLVNMDPVEARVEEKPQVLTEPAPSSTAEIPAPQAQTVPADSDQAPKGVETAPSTASTIKPVYPLGSRLRGEEGRVVLKVRVDASGNALEVTVAQSSGHPALDQSARRALQMTRFVPAKTGDQSHAAETTVSISFKLTD